MKIFYIPSGAGFFHDPIDEAIIQTLKELNIETHIYNLVQTPDVDYLSILDNIKPDLVLTFYGARLQREIMENIHNAGYKTAIWLVDDPYEIDNTVTFAIYFDYVFTIEENCIPIYKNAGVKNVHWLPLGTLPSRFKPMNVESKYHSDICIVGTAFNNRLEIVDTLADYLLSKNTKIIGRWWENLNNYQKLSSIIINQLIPPEEIVKYYNGAKININIHRIFNIFNQRNIPAQTPNNRTFDIAACSAFQLIDYREKLDQFYTPNEEIIIFQNAADLMRKIEYYLTNETERKKIAQLAAEKTLKKHTFRHKIKKLINIIMNN